MSFCNEGQEGKTGPFQGWVPVRGIKERVKEGKYSGSILYSCMKIEQQNLKPIEIVLRRRERYIERDRIISIYIKLYIYI
jgi:hypothetical protein